MREGYGIVGGAVYFCVDDVLDKFDGVVGDSVNLSTETPRFRKEHRKVLDQNGPERIRKESMKKRFGGGGGGDT